MAERSQIPAAREWVEGWRRAGRRLNELKKSELRAISTLEALQSLAGAFEACRLQFPLRPTSGLVEQQRWFGKLRK
jgi:hypothetical protein